jgi:hypothetical protein
VVVSFKFSSIENKLNSLMQLYILTSVIIKERLSAKEALLTENLKELNRISQSSGGSGFYAR